MEIEDIKRLRQLGLKVPNESEYIPIEDFTFENCDLFECQQNYKFALGVIKNQHIYIEELKKVIERLQNDRSC